MVNNTLGIDRKCLLSAHTKAGSAIGKDRAARHQGAMPDQLYVTVALYEPLYRPAASVPAKVSVPPTEKVDTPNRLNVLDAADGVVVNEIEVAPLTTVP